MNAIQQIQLIRTLADIIEETARESAPMGAPSGVIYSALNAYGVSLDFYQALLRVMIEEGKITVSNNLVKAGC